MRAAVRRTEADRSGSCSVERSLGDGLKQPVFQWLAGIARSGFCEAETLRGLRTGTRGGSTVAFEYVNRKDDRYYLQAGRTRTGKTRYYFGREMTGTPVEDLPEGYDVYESPATGQVHLRRSQSTPITPQERETVSDGIRRYASLEHFLIDVQGNSLVVYLPVMDEKAVDRLFETVGGGFLLGSARAAETKRRMMGHSQFSKMMRFQLVNAKKRLFSVQRWCFRGAIDDWLYLAGPKSLVELVQEYAPTLGKEDFFELF